MFKSLTKKLPDVNSKVKDIDEQIPWDEIASFIVFTLQNKFSFVRENNAYSQNQITHNIKEGLKKFVLENRVTKPNMLLNKMRQGHFDQEILSKFPKITDELEIILKNLNKELLQYLFANCKQKNVFEFWIKNGVNLPKNSLVTAIMFKSNKCIFEKLHENGFLNNIKELNKIELMQRATKLGKEALSYLGEKLNFKTTNLTL